MSFGPVEQAVDWNRLLIWFAGTPLSLFSPNEVTQKINRVLTPG